MVLDPRLSLGHDPGVTDLDEALTKLEQFNARQSQIVEQRYFGGLSLEETATVLNISLATVKRELRLARWCYGHLGGSLAELSPPSLETLNSFLPPHWSHGNPVDILGDADPERFRKAIETVVGKPVRIRCVVINARGKVPPNIPQDGMVATALNQGGKIVDVQE